MGVGISLHGASDTANWIQRLRERMSEVQHPAAGPIEIHDDGTFWATTTPAGPGYHIALCDELRRVSEELQIAWAPPEDEEPDEYFFEQNAAAVERQMLQWLKTVAQIMCEQELDKGGISMPIDHEYRFEGIATPLGPRTVEWVRAVAEDPRQGIDFFVWWTPGENAAALLGRALFLMWNEVCWRDPTCDFEEELNDEVLALLERAFALDPSLDYPAREWCEIGYEIPDEIEARAKTQTGPLIGYRRQPVRVRLSDGWSLEIPGEFSEEWTDDGWSAWYMGRTIWFNSFQKPGPASEHVLEVPAEGELFERCDGEVLKRAYLGKIIEDDGEYFSLTTRNAVEGKLAVVTIVYPDEDSREWAFATWESIKR